MENVPKGFRSSGALWWTVILLSAAALRILFLILPGSSLQDKVLEAVPDAQEYQRLAVNLIDFHTFTQDSIPPLEPEVFRTPVYPLFLTPFYALTSRPLVLVVLAQVVLSFGLILATYGLARSLRRSRGEALLAGLLVALSPNLAFLSTKAITETLFTVLLVLDLWFLDRYRNDQRKADLAIAGAVCGLLVLTRPIASFFPLCLAVYIMVMHSTPPWRVRSLRALLFLGCSAAVVFPWVLRNAAETGRWIVSTAAERNLCLYNAATVLASHDGIDLEQAHARITREGVAEQGGVEAPDDAHFWIGRSSVARRYMLRYPMTSAKVQMLGFATDFAVPIGLRQLLTHCGDSPDIRDTERRLVMQEAVAGAVGGRLKRVIRHVWEERLRRFRPFAIVVMAGASVYLLGVLLFSALGILHGRGVRWLLLPVLYFTTLTGPVGDARFRAPIEPLLAILASVGAVAALSWWRRRHAGAPELKPPRTPAGEA